MVRIRSKKWADRDASPAVKNAGQVVGEGKHVGAGEVRFVSVDAIEPDPDQPRTRLRKAGITKTSIVQHLAGKIDLADTNNPECAELFESLFVLAESIRRHNLINPISIHETSEGKYLVSEGERRYLAHLVIGADQIRAIIKPPIAEKDKKARQLIENVIREDLTLDEKLTALIGLNELHLKEGLETFDSNSMASVLGVTQRMARKYLGLLNAPEDVKAAVIERKIQSLTAALTVAGIAHANKRAAAIRKLEGGFTETQIKDSFKSEGKPAAAKPAPTKGRNKKFIQLGKIQNPNVVKKIISGYLRNNAKSGEAFDVDWSDPRAAQSAWDQFLKMVEGEGK